MTPDCWLSGGGEGRRRGHSAADTWNDWESAACSHYLVPCIVIITPALSAPVLPSLLAIVIVIDWCGGQNSAAWKGIRHTSHNRPAIWSPPPPPPSLLFSSSCAFSLFWVGGVDKNALVDECRLDAAEAYYWACSYSAWLNVITVCVRPRAWIDKCVNSLQTLEIWHDGWKRDVALGDSAWQVLGMTYPWIFPSIGAMIRKSGRSQAPSPGWRSSSDLVAVWSVGPPCESGKFIRRRRLSRRELRDRFRPPEQTLRTCLKTSPDICADI